MARTPKEPKEPKEEGAKRFWLSARTTAELNQALKDAAQSSGRSVSQEIEFRLEQSFKAEKIEADTRAKTVSAPDYVSELLFDSIRTAGIAAMKHMRGSWSGDIYARAAVKEAIISVFKSYTNNRRINVPAEGFDFARLQNAGKVGKAFGRLLGDLSDVPGSDALLSEMREVLAPGPSSIADLALAEDMRRDVALDDLDASLAA